MSWKKVAALNAHRLKLVLNVEQFAQQLGELPQTHTLGITAEQLADLAKEREQAERQRQRLEKGEFRVAVVGLEKAGKSTFINAWLGCDLLPSRSTRCTFTTTQIFSESEPQQRLEIQPKSESQFQRLLSELKIALGGLDETRAKNAKQDLESIQRYADSLKDVLHEGPHSKFFSSLNDIKDDLRKYVADERYAHAMHEVRLYTCRLAEAEGIVFYDVPGLDSGLAKHVEESKNMLFDCDAVILVQTKPSLRGAEKDIINFAREGDHHIRLEDKLFVFFGRMDAFATSDAFERDFQHIVTTWHEEANLSPERIVAGSAGAHIVLHGIAKTETLKDIGDKNKIVSDLRRVLKKEQATIDDLKNLTGIDLLKKRLNHYLNTERVAIVERRCNAISDKILKYSEFIYAKVLSHYPEDPDEARRRIDEDRTLSFNRWWSARKESIKADFNEYYSKELNSSFDETTMKSFLQRYINIVHEGMENLSARSLQKRDRKFFGSMQHGFDPEIANREWRDALYHDIRRLIEDIAVKLALELDHDTQKATTFISNKLWGNKRINSLLNGNDKASQERLQHSLRVLFLRFVRPLSEALIRAPVGSQTRMNIVRDNSIDLDILDYYYPEDGEEIYRVLKRYLRYGVALINDSNIAKSALEGKPVIAKNLRAALKQIASEMEGKSLDLSHRRQVVEEVEADLIALEHYLIYSLFNAAGFKAFCKQELENLRDRFLERLNDGSWDGIASSEWKSGNPLMLAELPADLHPQELNIEVSDRLRQLGTALRYARATL